MITIFIGTNRTGNYCQHIAAYVSEVLASETSELIEVLALEGLPGDVLHSSMYQKEHQHPLVAEWQDRYLVPASKWIIISPEYNGSFPGVLKMFLDACSVRKYKETFRGKKVGLIGVASGRSGNVRGNDHLTGVLNYLGSLVYPEKMMLPKVHDLLNDEQVLADEPTRYFLRQFLLNFLAF